MRKNALMTNNVDKYFPHSLLIAGAPEIPEEDQEPEDEPLGKILIIFIP